MKWLLLCVALSAPLSSQTSLEERLAATRQQVSERCAELAQQAYELGLFREASQYERLALEAAPGATVPNVGEQVKSIEAREFASTYKKALEKSGRKFRKVCKSALTPVADEFVAIGSEAEEQGRTEFAEAAYLRAFELNGSNDAEKALRKLDYDVIFNYGVIPEAERDAARTSLKRLGGGFLRSKDLAKELEFWNDAWGLKTKHYRFVTNAKHTKVFAFAQACEDLHAAWQQFVKKSGLKLKKAKKPHRVYLFDSKSSYETILRVRGQEPLDSDGVLGFYAPSRKTGFFYDDPEFYGDDTTLLFETFYHEGAHQLFDVCTKTPWKGHMAKHELQWVEEGFCTYLEPLVIQSQGDQREYRIATLIDDDLADAIDGSLAGELLSSSEFVHMSSEAWDAYDYGYPHASLLVHFLIHGNDGAHRKDAFELLVAERTMGGLRKQTLFELVGMEPEELDAAIQAYARQISSALPRRKYAE